jgi:hypothetical protein
VEKAGYGQVRPPPPPPPSQTISSPYLALSGLYKRSLSTGFGWVASPWADPERPTISGTTRFYIPSCFLLFYHFWIRLFYESYFFLWGSPSWERGFYEVAFELLLPSGAFSSPICGDGSTPTVVNLYIKWLSEKKRKVKQQSI